MTDYQTKAMITALKDISTQLKTINRNVNYIGRKLEMIDSTLQKHGIAIMPGAELTAEEPEKDRNEGLAPMAELKKKLADEIVEKCF